MRSRLITTLTVIGAVTVLVLAANTVAMATTGRAILAGKINKATKITSLTRTTSGTGLQVRTRSSANAPFAVNGRGKVVNLNADTVDGVDSSRMLNQPYVITKHLTTTGTTFVVNVNMPVGTYAFSYSAYFTSSPVQTLGKVACFMVADGGATTRYVGETDVISPDVGAGVSGSGVITRPSTATAIQLSCTTGVQAIQGFGEQQPIQIVLTKVDVVKPLAARSSNARTGK